MIYLIQDCYKNDKGEYIDILKIGYSDKPFMKSQKRDYANRFSVFDIFLFVFLITEIWRLGKY